MNAALSDTLPSVSVTGMRARCLAGAFAALLVAGCASNSAAGDERVLDLEASSHPSRPVSGQPVRWVLELRNRSDEPVTVSFPTTQRGDVRLAEDGVDVYHWAERRAFSTVQDRVVVLGGDTVAFELGEPRLSVPPGEYEMLASVRGIAVNRVVRETLTVRASGG